MTDLKAIAERINRLMDERDGLAEDIREVLSEAKEKGWEPAILRRVIAEQRRRAKAPSDYDEAQEISDLYRAAIEGGPDPVSGRLVAAAALYAEGQTVQEVAAALGVGNGTAGRLRQMAVARALFIPSQEIKRDGMAEPHDPETGEVLPDNPPVLIPVPVPAPAPVVGNDWPDLPPFMVRQ